MPLRSSCLLHAVRCEEYKPSRRSIAPSSPTFVQAAAALRILRLYSAVNRRREVFSGTSVSRTVRAADSSFGFIFRAFSAPSIYKELGPGDCLSIVGTEGILAEGFTPIAATELDAIELDGQPGPPRPIVLTFDAGYANFYRHAYPALRARGLPATMFLIAARVGEDEASRVRDERGDFLTWPEVRAMQADGIDFQSHSVSHRNLKHLSDDEVRAELQESRRQLEAGLGRPVTVLAYPFGGNSPHTQALVEDAGYRSAHSVMAGMGGDFARLRTSLGQRTSLDDLRAALRGSWFGETSDLR